MLLGDFNARTSKSEDYISNEGSAITFMIPAKNPFNI
jgi:hypothetical protein